MSEVFNLQMGKTPSRENPLYWNGRETWVSIGDLGFSKYISTSKECITKRAVAETGIKIFPKGSVLMSFKLSVGKTAIAATDLYSNEAIMSFNPKEGFLLSPEYVYYYLKGYKWDGLNRAVMGFTLNKNTISQGVFSYPPLEEQERIVAELDLLTGVIEKQKAQLKELDNLAQSIFYDMFGDILTAQPSQSLKDIAEYYIGLTYKPDDISEKGTIVLRSSNIQDNSLDFKDIVRVVTNISESKIVKEGDILMCVRNGSARLVGKVARIKNLPEKMSFGAFMTIIRSQHNDFLYYFFLSDFFRSQLKTSKTATINQITSKMLDNIRLNVPDKTIQQKFAEKIEAIEHQKTLIKKSIEETQKLFDYTMDKYFG